MEYNSAIQDLTLTYDIIITIHNTILDKYAIKAINQSILVKASLTIFYEGLNGFFGSYFSIFLDYSFTLFRFDFILFF